MRWFFVIIFLLPSVASADQSTRNELISFMKKWGTCEIIFRTLIFDDLHDNRFKKSQLIMQYEIDENMFSMEKIESYHKLIMEKVLKFDLRQKFSSLTADEQEYMDFKGEQFETEAVAFINSMADDPEQLAAEIKQCVTEIELSD